MVPSTHFVVHTLLPMHEDANTAVKIKFRISQYAELQKIGESFLINSQKFGMLAVLPLWEGKLAEYAQKYSIKMVYQGINPITYVLFTIGRITRIRFKLIYLIQGEEKYKEWAGIAPIDTNE